MTEEKRPQPVAKPGGAPAPRPKLGSVVSPTRQAPTPLKVSPAGAGSPRAPAVAPTAHLPPEPRAETGSNPSPTETTSGMSQIAIEAALADLSSWRREADRKILHLEAELAQLRANGAVHASLLMGAGPPTLDLSAAGVHPPPAAGSSPALKEPAPPWAPQAPAAIAHAPLPAIAPMPSAPHAPFAQPAAPVVVQAPVAGPAASSAAASDLQAPPEPPRVASIARAQPRVQYDLELKPGESFDLPTGLDGGRRKRATTMLFVLLIVGGMAALVIASLASQR